MRHSYRAWLDAVGAGISSTAKADEARRHQDSDERIW